LPSARLDVGREAARAGFVARAPQNPGEQDGRVGPVPALPELPFVYLERALRERGRSLAFAAPIEEVCAIEQGAALEVRIAHPARELEHPLVVAHEPLAVVARNPQARAIVPQACQVKLVPFLSTELARPVEALLRFVEQPEEGQEEPEQHVRRHPYFVRFIADRFGETGCVAQEVGGLAVLVEAMKRPTERQTNARFERRRRAFSNDRARAFGELARSMPLEQPVEGHRLVEHDVGLGNGIAALDGELAREGKIGKRAIVAREPVACDAAPLERALAAIVVGFVELGERARVKQIGVEVVVTPARPLGEREVRGGRFAPFSGLRRVPGETRQPDRVGQGGVAVVIERRPMNASRERTGDGLGDRLARERVAKSEAARVMTHEKPRLVKSLEPDPRVEWKRIAEIDLHSLEHATNLLDAELGRQQGREARVRGQLGGQLVELATGDPFDER
jgi:hypothetical protein